MNTYPYTITEAWGMTGALTKIAEHLCDFYQPDEKWTISGLGPIKLDGWIYQSFQIGDEDNELVNFKLATGPGDAVFRHAFAKLTKEDAAAIAAFLKSMKPVEHKVPGPLGPGEKPTFPVLTLIFPEGTPQPAK